MAAGRIMVDTNILIEHFRKESKEYTLLTEYLVKYDVYISSVSEFEVLEGANEEQVRYWDGLFNFLNILEFESAAAHTAGIIVQELKKKRKSIEKTDLFIAATAVTHNLVFDTGNRKDFEHIAGLHLL